MLANGAVSGAIGDAKLGKLTQLLDQIKSTIIENDLDETSKNNVRLTIKDITNYSSVIADLVKEEKVKIVGAFYDISTGKVELLD